jgi:hypothetical protein
MDLLLRLLDSSPAVVNQATWAIGNAITNGKSESDRVNTVASIEDIDKYITTTVITKLHEICQATKKEVIPNVLWLMSICLSYSGKDLHILF